MRDEGEVGEVPLDAGVQEQRRPSVAQGRPVLVEQVHQLFGHLAASTDSSPL